jgi:2-keto-4-pentenoate hydratase/2-oxohepta-3-ene-1,7-dioic acid hydratase in catechol pathway
MRLVTFQSEDGIRHGILRGEPANGQVMDLGPGDLLGLIESGHVGDGPQRDAAGVRLLAPLLRPPKLLALARNYQDHITEGGGQPVDKARIVPKLFLKPSSAIIGPDAPLCLPGISATTDWEVELAVIIGRHCRNIAVEDALGTVFGYTIANDISARTTDWGIERHPPDVWNDFFDWLNGKWPDGFAPLGPYVLTADELPDPQNLELSLHLNGEQRQHSSTREMISTVAETIAFASRFMTLEPGDVIETGTPAGVGATTGSYLKRGDVMEARIEKLGVLRTPVQ